MELKAQLHKWEPVLLFSILFLPGYIAQAGVLAPSLPTTALSFSTTGENLFYLSVTLPKIALLIYILLRDRATPLSSYGIGVLSRKHIIEGLLAALVVVGVALGINFLFVLAGSLEQPNFATELRRPISGYHVVPLVALSSLATGYLEEGYFHSYLIVRGESIGIAVLPLILAVNLLFSFGHIYQGIQGVAITFALGVVLSLLFLKRRSLHTIAWCHGAYNLLIILANGVA